MIDKARQIAGVINVRVSDDDRVHGGCIEWRLLPIAIAQVVATLKQSAIDEHASAISFDQVLRSRNSSRGAPK